MTREEAMQRLKYDREMCYFDPSTGETGQPYSEDCKEMAQALDIAIKILENGSCEQPEQKTAHWYSPCDYDPPEWCSNCHTRTRWAFDDGYCPKCGAKIEEGDERRSE